MRIGQLYENIFSGTQVKIITTYRNEVEYERSPVTIDWTTDQERLTTFIKPSKVFMQTYKPVENLLT